MLVAFEGQDGAGKTTLLEAVHTELRKRGIPCVTVAEFSDSPYGQRLVEAVARDKFLRPVSGEPATYLTRALEEVADLYYLDERVIGPELEQGQVVLKDRHQDTLFYTLAPMLAEAGAIGSRERALLWLEGLMNELRHPPDLTVYVSAPLSVRLERIAQRTRDLVEDRANEVSDEDRAVFVARDRLMADLIGEALDQYLLIENGNPPIATGAQAVVAAIRSRLTSTEGGS